jgi:hypothetical protein
VGPDVTRALELNRERHTSAPLFVAIGYAGILDSTRCVRAVEAVSAVSVPILFEHILPR